MTRLFSLRAPTRSLRQRRDQNASTTTSKNCKALGMALLALMVVQNSSTVLVGRFTRTASSEQYAVAHMIIVTEALKLGLSAVLLVLEGRNFKEAQLGQPLKMAVPALLYLIQNSLIYLSLAHVSAPLFQVAYQSKLITTALLSSLLLRRTYVLRQWISIVALTVGVAIVVIASNNNNSSANTNDNKTLFGLSLVAISCLCSSFAGVYFEKVIKNQHQGPPLSLWARNIQLSFFSLLIALLQEAYHAYTDANDTTTTHFLAGFTPWVYLQIGLLGGGGLLVAAVIKHTDSVQKGLATGVSVVVSSILSHLVFGETELFSTSFLTGAALIVGGVFFFSNEWGCSSSSSSSSSLSDRSSSSRKWRNGLSSRALFYAAVVLQGFMLFHFDKRLVMNVEHHSSYHSPTVREHTATSISAWSNLTFSFQHCRGLPYVDAPSTDGCIIDSSSHTGSSSKLTVDIMSIGSVSNIKMLETQSSTWASHKSVRFFLGALEADEADPTCYQTLTKEQMVGISGYCRTQAKKKYGHSHLMRYMMKKYAGGDYLADKPPGWLCANKRPGVIFGKLGRLYREIQKLPDYLIYLDDDGYYNMELFESFVQNLDSWEPTAHAGCMIQEPLHTTNFSFPFGGFGLILSRGTLTNLIRPIHCKNVGADATNTFQGHVCAQLKKNMFGEQESFVDGMSLSDLMAAHASRDSYTSPQFKDANYPFCLHGDWMMGYYINYYHVSDQIPNDWFRDRPEFRIRPDLGVIYGANKNYNPPRNCLNDGVCHIDSQACHHLPAEIMQDLTHQSRLTHPTKYRTNTTTS